MLKIHNHLDILKRIDRFSSLYTQIHTREELALRVEEILEDLLEYSYSGLYLYDLQEERLKLLIAKGFTPEEQAEADRTAMERHPGHVFRTKQIINIPDVENDPEHISVSSKRGFIVRSRLFMPVLNGENTVGVFGIVSPVKNQFTEEYLIILSFVCNIAGGIYGNIINQEQLRKTSLIAQETDNVVIITNKNGETEWVNRSFERLTGHSFAEIRGKKPGELLQGPDTDLSVVKELAIAVDEHLPIERDLLNYTKDGKSYWVKVQIQPVFNKSGELTNFISLQRDISEQKKAENKLNSISTRLATLIKNLQAGILVEDEFRNIALLNQAFCDMFGIPVNPDLMIGFDCSGSAEQSKGMFRDPETFIKKIEHILGQKEPVLNEVLELADGRIFERDYIPIFLDNRFLGNLWQYRDITAQKQAENELRKAKNEAESANAAKSLFLANMSHEIRTPLNAVIGLAKLMRSTPLNPDQKKLNDNLLVSGENLLAIINEILDFSKIEAGKVDLETIPFSLKESLDKVYRFLELAAEEKMIRLSVSLDPKIGKPVSGDQTRLQQVLTNLVNNAIKFTPAGSVEVTCRLVDETPEKYTLRFEVRDTGIGISDEKLKTIFEKFKQEDESVTRVYGGTGLGLAISKQLVELMGGTLGLESQKGVGSRFFFTIVLPVSSREALSERNKKILINPLTLTGKKVLVVEDNEFNQFIAKSILEKWHLMVTLAENGQVALEKIRKQQFDVILMDMQMPVLDGCSATKILRQELKIITPVVALTAFATQDAISKALNAGMDDYMTKPFEEDLLYAQLLKSLGITPEYITTDKPEEVTLTPGEVVTLFDLDNLYELMGDDPQEMINIIEKFIELTPSDCDAVFNAFSSNNIDALAKAAHKVKSSIDLFAAAGLRSNIRTIHEYAKTNQHIEQLPDLIAYMKTNIPVMMEQLEEKAQQLKKSIS